jgi:hypothetical protein
LAFIPEGFKAGLKLSSKEFIVPGIITRFPISKGVVSRGRHHLEELGASRQSLENNTRRPTVISSIESKPLIAGFHRRLRSALVAISAAPLQQVEGVLPERYLKKLTGWPSVIAACSWWPRSGGTAD